MAIQKAETRPEGVITGRYGLWVPTEESVFLGTPKEKFLTFFQKLWRANGYGPKPKHFPSLDKQLPLSPRLVFPEGFSHELVLPATKDKPLMVLKGSLTPEDRSEVEAQARLSALRAEWGQWSSVTSGKEQHGIYVPPAGLGQFEPLITVTQYHQYGGSDYSFVEPSTRVSRLGQELNEE